MAKAKGYQVGGSGSGSSSGGATGEKEFDISIKGDSAIRDALMQEYKNYVESELKKSGAFIHGRGVSGKVSGFDFKYDGAGATGLFRAKGVVDQDGFIEIDVLMYEHK